MLPRKKLATFALASKTGEPKENNLVHMWLLDLIREPSYFQMVILISLISALGLALGELKLRGVSLGTAFVFFTGIAIGHVCDCAGIVVDPGMLSFAQNFGLVLFVYALGVQVGPGFFPSLKRGGLKCNLFGLLTICLTTLTALLVYAFTGMSFTDAVGLLCGAVTNTPMLGAAQQFLIDMDPSSTAQVNNMATACALAYPCGVIGVLGCVVFFRKLSRGEKTRVTDPAGDTYVAEFHISNPAVFNHPVGALSTLTDKHIIISRIMKGEKVLIPSSTTVLEKDDHILAVLRRDDLTAFKVLFGEQDKVDLNRPDIDWNNIDDSDLVSKHILVTRKEMNGVKIGSLHLRNSFDINITRVNRAGVQLVAYPGLRLQLGDRLTVVGTEAAIGKVGEILGNEEKLLNRPNLVAIFLGLLLGVVLGAVPFVIPGMGTAIKLGVAGGPIIVGILMGAFGSRFHLSTYTTRSANLMIRQFGIVIYLACLGFSAGPGFADTVLSLRGLQWLGASLLIAVLPVLVVGLIAMRAGRLDYPTNVGMLCAAMANPMALTYANANSNEAEASEAYATVYPLSMFIRVISAQLLMMMALS